MAINSIQSSSVSFSYQYSSMQLGLQAGNGNMPALAGRGPDGLAGLQGQMQSLAQNVAQTFRQLGISFSEPRGGGAQAGEAVAEGSGSVGTGPDSFKEALHDFVHALFHAMKEAGSEAAGHGEQGSPGEGGLAASYTSVSFSLEVLSVRVEGAESGDAGGELASAGENPVARLLDAYKKLIDNLGDPAAADVSLKDFLKQLQKNSESSTVAVQQMSFSMEVSLGSLVYTQA